MAKSSQAKAMANRPARLDLSPESAAVTLLGSSSRNLDLDFWAQVILSENRHIRMGIEEMRERMIDRIEKAILNGEEPATSACKKLGVPTFADLVRANADDFCSNVLKKIGI